MDVDFVIFGGAPLQERMLRCRYVAENGCCVVCFASMTSLLLEYCFLHLLPIAIEPSTCLAVRLRDIFLATTIVDGSSLNSKAGTRGTKLSYCSACAPQFRVC